MGEHTPGKNLIKAKKQFRFENCERSKAVTVSGAEEDSSDSETIHIQCVDGIAVLIVLYLC